MDEKVGGKAFHVTRLGLDPYGVMGWDMPTVAMGNPRDSGKTWPSKTDLDRRYRKIAGVIRDAESEEIPIPYSILDLNESRDLLRAKRGFNNVRSDMEDGRREIHERKWNPLADDWDARLSSPPDYGTNEYKYNYPWIKAPITNTTGAQSSPVTNRMGPPVTPRYKDRRSASPVSFSQESIHDTPSRSRTPNLGSASAASGEPGRSRLKDKDGNDTTFMTNERRQLPSSKVLLAKTATSDDQGLMLKLEAVENEFNKKLREIKQAMSQNGKGKEPFIEHESDGEEMDIDKNAAESKGIQTVQVRTDNGGSHRADYKVFAKGKEEGLTQLSFHGIKDFKLTQRDDLAAVKKESWSQYGNKAFVGACISEELFDQPVYATLNARGYMSLKVYVDGRGNAVSFDELSLDEDIVKTIKANHFLTDGDLIVRDHLKDYLQ